MTFNVAIGPSSFAEVDDAPFRLLQECDISVRENPYKRRLSEEEIMLHLAGMDGLIAGLEPLNRSVLCAADRLKAIARVGIGMDNVDLATARELSIKISNTPDAPSAAVAEMTLTALLAIQRRLISLNADMHEGQWRKVISPGLFRKKILLIGYGRIARKLCNFLTPFGVELLVNDPYIESTLVQGPAHIVTLEAGLPEADVISLHASGSDVILDDREFAMMRDGVVILNSARGELVNEAALIASLQAGKVAGAWFDAFSVEPYSGKLTAFDEVLLTPHICTYTEICRREMELQAVHNLLRDLGVNPPP